MAVELAKLPIDDDLLAPIAPTDGEVVTTLRRLAAAQAHLLAAEQAAAEARGAPGVPRRVPEIEEARTALLWAQAHLLLAARPGRRRRGVQEAEAALAELLARHGFASFEGYMAARRRAAEPAEPSDPRLDLARREHEAATAAWAELQGEFADRTVVIDLTGDEPRRLA